jgi:hypothetical protein
MVSRIAPVLAFAGVFLSGCNKSPPQSDPVSGSDGMIVDGAEVGRLEKESYGGSSEASRALAYHYGASGDSKKSDEFFLKSARQGDCEITAYLLDKARVMGSATVELEELQVACRERETTQPSEEILRHTP